MSHGKTPMSFSFFSPHDKWHIGSCHMQLYTRDSSKSWRQAGSDGSSQLSLKEPSTNVVLADYVTTKKWQQVVDFDDHLDDISK